MPEAYKIPCEEYDRLVRRVEAVEKENAELRARVAELETGKFPGGISATSVTVRDCFPVNISTISASMFDPNIAAQIEAGSPGPDWNAKD